MRGPVLTSDFASNANEQIAHVAKKIGRSPQKRAVFEVVYSHKAKARTVDEIVARTRLTRIQVLKIGSALDGIAFDRIILNGKIAYARRREYHAYKSQILDLAGNLKKAAKFPTKRKVTVNLPKSVFLSISRAKAKRIYIDDVTSFGKVKRVKNAGSISASISEDQFKCGIQLIIGEPGEFTHWPGEKWDLYTSRLILKGKRVTAIFALKGPGLKSKLTLGNMGKNGNQLLHLFQEEADAFFVQHWREIDPDVVDMMHRAAVAKSVSSGRQIWYGTIDGKDSQRIVVAYPRQFRIARKPGKSSVSA